MCRNYVTSKFVVGCATCHCRMHYADVGEPVRDSSSWRVTVDGEDTVFDVSEGELDALGMLMYSRISFRARWSAQSCDPRSDTRMARS